jgi:hypothetical protein
MVLPQDWRSNVRTFIAALSLLALVAAASSFVSLKEHRHAGQADRSIFPVYPSGGWERLDRGLWPAGGSGHPR